MSKMDTVIPTESPLLVLPSVGDTVWFPWKGDLFRFGVCHYVVTLPVAQPLGSTFSE